MKKLLLVAGILFASFAGAQDWPGKSVRFIVPYPPGGSTDLSARTVADRLSRALGEQFVVDNRAGAAGAIGSTEAARAPADGYTFLFAADTVVTSHLVMKLQFDVQRDFVPVTQVTTQPITVAVHPSLGVSNVRELIAYAKANPGKLSFAHSGIGTGQHMSGELLKRMAGIDMVHVPYKGGGPAVKDLVGGQVLVGVLGSTPLIPHYRAGRIKIIAFTSKERFAPVPDVPTLHESGLTGFDTTQWLGLLAPKGTDPKIVSRLHGAVAKVLAMPEVKERLAQAALAPVGNTPEEFAAVIRADLERWNKLGKELGLKPQ